MSCNKHIINNDFNQLKERLLAANQTIHEAIVNSGIYLRISLTNSCNLNCHYCLNEGVGKDISDVESNVKHAIFRKCLELAPVLGFKRIQFTGGEPLLASSLPKFILFASRYFEDVGITTNGTLLQKKIPGLFDKGLNRLHISLHSEVLTSQNGCWKLPEYFKEIIKISLAHGVTIRFNLPVAPNALDQLESFLIDFGYIDSELAVYTLLSYSHDANTVNTSEYVEKIHLLVKETNRRRQIRGMKKNVLFRRERKPAGLRCPTCDAQEMCRDRSKALRLGADCVLRPCLMSRKWDLPCKENLQLDDFLYKAALLATDF